MIKEISATIRSNLLWFSISFLLAFLIWIIATTQANPIGERGFTRIPVQIEIPDTLILTNDPTRLVRVDVRAQQSVLNRLTNDDIIVRANMNMTEPGQYIVPLIVEIARTASADTQPTQITVTLERVVTQQKPVQLIVEEAPAADLDFTAPTPDILQVQVSGASNQVANVVAVHGTLDLSQQRTSLELDVPLVPVDIDGDVVPDVTLVPRSTRVSVNLIKRDDVQQVSVRPNILVTTLPAGYLLESISYEPQTIFLSGSPIDLNLVGTSINTESISLDGRTDDFTLSVPLALPTDNLIVLNDQNIVTVTVGINAQTSAVQLDSIPITIVGAREGFTVQVTPQTISVVLNGAIEVLESVTSVDIEATVDVNGLAAGTYELEPNIVIRQGQVTVDARTALPSLVSVSITNNAVITPTEPTDATQNSNTTTPTDITPDVTVIPTDNTASPDNTR